MIKLDAPKGLGDAIYLRAAALHLLDRGHDVMVFTPWPEVFSGMRVAILPRSEVPRHAQVRRLAYGNIPAPAGAAEFQARCLNAGITDPVELRLDWKRTDERVVAAIRRSARGRPVLVFQPFRVPHNNDQELTTPRREAFDRFLIEHADWFRVRLGHPPFVEDRGSDMCELDLYGRAFIKGTFDIGTIADLCFAQPSSMSIMAEAMGKRFVCLFPRAAERHGGWQWETVKPERAINKRELCTVLYDE